MKSILNAIKNGLSKVLSIFTSGRAQAVFDAAVKLVPEALPIVEVIAKITPTGADDEIIALFRQYGMPFVDNYLALPVEQRGAALMRTASTVLARQFPGTPTRILDTAVQMAYLGWRAENP